MLINAMTKNFGKTHQDLPNFKLPAIQNASKKQTMFALQPETTDFGSIPAANTQLKSKGAGILKPTASNENKNGPYKAKKSLGNVMRARVIQDKKHKKMIEEMDDVNNPPPISEDDINKGMMTLLNKGVIPKDIDLTPAFEKGAPPVQFRGMRFHEKEEQYVKTEVFTEQFNKNNIKFDLQPIQELVKDEEHSTALVPYIDGGQTAGTVGTSTNMQLALPAATGMKGTGMKTTMGSMNESQISGMKSSVQ